MCFITNVDAPVFEDYEARERLAVNNNYNFIWIQKAWNFIATLIFFTVIFVT